MSEQIKCASCGRFIPYAAMGIGGRARCEVTPLSDRSREKIEWVCAPCADAKGTING